MKIPILLVISAYSALATNCDLEEMYDAKKNGKEILKSLHKNKKMIDYASITDTIEYYCAKPCSKKFNQVYYNDTQIKTKLDIKAPIVFVIGGWCNTGKEQWAITLSEEWLKYYHTNVCRVSYTKYSKGNYIDVAMYNIRIVAQLVTLFIKQLNSIYKMPYDRVTLAGFSLGGQMSGFIGQNLNSQIGHIFGLDPAGPLFTVPIILPKNDRLDPSDAKRVVVIHSCDGLLGVSIDCGHQDFYPNYGTYPQPGCIWPFQQEVYPTDGPMQYSSAYCSHVRAVQFLVEALKPDNKCIGLKCACPLQYKLLGIGCRGTEQLSINRNGKPDIIAVSWEEWWTYDGISGPAFWGLINPEWSLCNRGRRQSPVNLEPQRLLFDPNLRPIHIDKHRISGVISNTGHSVIFTVDNETVIQYGTSPQISVNLTGGPLSYKYRFQEIHVHYGLHDQFGSEHSVEGYTFPAEIQLFGYNSQLYSNFSEALNRAQGIVGVSVLLQLGDLSNPELRMLTDQLDKIRYGGDEAPVRRISIRGLLPETDHYMTYEGSTTAPACHETVTWIVLNKPIYITKQQMHALRRLMQGSPDHPKAPLGNNFRPPQQLYHRPVRTNIDFRGKQNGKICPTMYRDVHYKANSWKQH